MNIVILVHDSRQLPIEKVQYTAKDLVGLSGDFKPLANESYQSNRIKAPDYETYVFNPKNADGEAGGVDFQVQVLECNARLLDIMRVNCVDNDSEGKERISSNSALSLCINTSQWISLSTFWISRCPR